MAPFFKASLAGAILFCGLFTCQRAWDNPYNEAAYNTLPVAVITVTRVPGVDASAFVFDASLSSDVEDPTDSLSVRWDWESDGTWDTDWGTAKTDTHTYATGGKKVVRVAVRDLNNGIADGLKELGVDFTTVTRLDSFVFYAYVDAAPVAFAAGDLVRWDRNDDGTWDTGWDSVTADTFGYPDEGTYTIRLEVRYTDGRTDQVATAVRVLLHPGMKLIAGGAFQMGSDYEDIQTVAFPGTFADEKPVHGVTVSSFWMDSTEITQDDYLAVMGENPSYIAGTGDYPVEQTTWFDAVRYCNARSRRDGLDTVYTYTGCCEGCAKYGYDSLVSVSADPSRTGYRLPTEAEWEFACRGGAATWYHFGDSTDILPDYAWYQTNTEGHRTRPVAGLLPNQYGLYDMHGNVQEWCHDWYDAAYYGVSAAVDPVGPATGGSRVARGGSFKITPAWLRSASRGGHAPGTPTELIGFRAVLPVR